MSCYACDNNHGRVRIRGIAPDSEVLCVVMTKVEDIVSYWQHFDGATASTCTMEDDSCPGCIEGHRRVQRFLMNIYDLDHRVCYPLLFGKQFLSAIAKATGSEPFGWRMLLGRWGTGLDTNFTADAVRKEKPLPIVQTHDLLVMAESTMDKMKTPRCFHGGLLAPVVDMPTRGRRPSDVALRRNNT